MLMCRQAAKALTKEHYYALPWHRRIGLKVHVALCAMCGTHHRQVMDMQDGVRGFLDHEDADDILPDVHLPDETRDRIQESIRQS